MLNLAIKNNEMSMELGESRLVELMLGVHAWFILWFPFAFTMKK